MPGFGAAGGVAAIAAAIPLAASFTPSERARAQGAALEVDISDLAPSATKTVEWRGKPIWVTRRTPQMTAALLRSACQVSTVRGLDGFAADLLSNVTGVRKEAGYLLPLRSQFSRDPSSAVIG